MKMEIFLFNYRKDFIFYAIFTFILLINPSISVAEDGNTLYVQPSAVPSSINSNAIPLSTYNPGSMGVKSEVSIDGNGFSAEATTKNGGGGSAEIKSPFASAKLSKDGKKAEGEVNIQKEKNNGFGVNCSLDGKVCENTTSIGIPENKIFSLGVKEKTTSEYSTNSNDFRIESAKDLPYNRKDQPIKTVQDCTSYQASAIGGGVNGEKCNVPNVISADEARLCKDDPEKCKSPSSISSETTEITYSNGIPITNSPLKVGVGASVRYVERFHPDKETYDRKCLDHKESLNGGKPGMCENDGIYRTSEIIGSVKTSIKMETDSDKYKIKVTPLEVNATSPYETKVTTPDQDAMDALNDNYNDVDPVLKSIEEIQYSRMDQFNKSKQSNEAEKTRLIEQAKKTDSTASGDNGFVDLLSIVGATLETYQKQNLKGNNVGGKAKSIQNSTPTNISRDGENYNNGRTVEEMRAAEANAMRRAPEVGFSNPSDNQSPCSHTVTQGPCP